MEDIKKFNVLLAADAVGDIDILSGILMPEYNVLTSGSGKEAVRMAAEKQPEVILLSAGMPAIDGREVISILKSDERTRNIPVILLLNPNGSDEEKWLDLQAADFISKPFGRAVVKLRVHNQTQLVSSIQTIEEDMRNHAMLTNILNGIDALITVIEPDTHRILFLNDSIRSYFGLEGDCIGRLCYEVLQGLKEPCKGCPYLKLLEEPDKIILWEHHESVKGSVLRKSARMIDWVGGKKAHLEYAIDITETRKMEQNIIRMAAEIEKVYYDTLTGIYNRRYFEEQITRHLSLLSRASGTLSVMMVDIDFFKKYNDTYGHMAGDECLKTVAETIKGCTHRDDDFVARYGGEEFVVVLPNTDENGARMLAGKILKEVHDRHILHEKSSISDFVTVSIGVVTGQVRYARTHTRDDYLKPADEMLYESKSNGRNRYTFKLLE